MRFKKPLFVLVFCVVFATVNAQKYKVNSNTEVKTSWNGNTFSSTASFAENISKVTDFSFLNSVFKDKELENKLAYIEMVTIFAPLDVAFTSLSQEKRDALILNTSKMGETMKFLSVPGRLDFNSIKNAIEVNSGTAYFFTVSGTKLGAKMVDGKVVLFDSENNTATITATDFYHKNGLFHMVNGLVYSFSEGEK
jgi:uncharacterized surface protein with fasciclin (FAS1) repeats